MIQNTPNFDDRLLQQLYDSPSQFTCFFLEKLLADHSTKAEKIAEFVQQNPEIKHLQSIGFEGFQVPDERHNRLIQLCPKIYRITLFGCDRSRRDFSSIVNWIQQNNSICSLWLPFSSACWPQFVGLTQITELNIHEWQASDSREVYSNLINSMPHLTTLSCQPREDLECLTLIHFPDQIKSLSLSYAFDACSRTTLNRFSKIQHLDLTHNKPEALSNEILQSLDLPCITALKLSANNQLMNKGIASLTRFAHLNDLDLSFCKNFEDEDLFILVQHLQFSSLTFNGCPKITQNGLSHLNSQKNLYSLTFGGGEYIHNLSFMQSLSELRTLFIEHSQLDEAPESVPMLTHLKKLVLLAIWDAPRVNDMALAALSGMTHLINLQVCRSSITSAGEAIIESLTRKEVAWIG